jgi:hypothetical protein
MYRLIGVALLSSCSISGTILLHNGSGGPVEVGVSDHRYELAPGEATEVEIDPIFGHQYFSVRISNERFCYQIPKVDPHWIWRGRVLALLDPSGRIYLSLPKSSEESYFNNIPATQPTDFPLVPTAC